MFYLLDFSLRTDHVLGLSVLLYYLNHPIVFIIIVTGSYINLQNEKLRDIRKLPRRSTDEETTWHWVHFLYFPQTISGGGCKMKMLRW